MAYEAQDALVASDFVALSGGAMVVATVVVSGKRLAVINLGDKKKKRSGAVHMHLMSLHATGKISAVWMEKRGGENVCVANFDRFSMDELTGDDEPTAMIRALMLRNSAAIEKDGDTTYFLMRRVARSGGE